MNRFLTDRVSPSVLGFYESRLALALRAWALRALSQAEAAFDREYVRLTALENALSRLQRSLEGDVKRLESASRSEGSDLVYRRFAPRDALRQTYAAVRPSPDIAERILTELGRTGEQAPDEAPRFLIASELTAAIAREVPVEPHVLGSHLGGVVVDFVEEMAERLAVPLEVNAFDARTAERSYVFGPDWCRDALDGLRQRMPSIPEVLSTTDDSRVFVLALRVALPREAIVVLERAS